jgi:hypothetical protein
MYFRRQRETYSRSERRQAPDAADATDGRRDRDCRLHASGKLLGIRQVLQENYRAELNKWTRDDVLINVGRPFETSCEVWSYRYVENNVNDLIFNFYEISLVRAAMSGIRCTSNHGVRRERFTTR